MSDVTLQVKLIELLGEKLLLAEALLELTAAQREALALDDVEPFADNLEERQRIMDSIDKLDVEAGKLSRGLKGDLPKAESADAQTLENIGRVGALTDRIKAVFGEIIDVDKKNAPLVLKKLDDYREVLREARESMRGEKAYSAPYALEDGVYFDTKK